MKKVQLSMSTVAEELYLAYEFDEEEDTELDEDTLELLETGVLKGVVPTEYIDEEDSIVFRVSKRTPMADVLKGEVSYKTLLPVIGNIALTLQEIKENGVPLSHLILNKEFIYVDPKELTVEFLCLPIEELVEEFDLKGFLRTLMANICYADEVNADYVPRILTLINGEDFSLDALVVKVATIMEDYGMDQMDAADADIVADLDIVEEAVETPAEEIPEVSIPEEMEVPAEEIPVEEEVKESEEPSETSAELETEEPVEAEAPEEEPAEEIPADEEVAEEILEEAETVEEEIPEESVASEEPVEEDVSKSQEEESETPKEQEDEDMVLLDDVVEEPEPLKIISEEEKKKEDSIKDALARIMEAEDEAEAEAKPVRVSRVQIMQQQKEEEAAAATEEKEEVALEKEEAIEEVADAKDDPKKKKKEKAKAKAEPAPKAPQAPVIKANPFLIRINTNERIMITKAKFNIGKANMGIDYTVTGNGSLANKHAIIYSKDGAYYIKDNKTFSTYVNGEQVMPALDMELPDNALIVLGNEEFTFKLS